MRVYAAYSPPTVWHHGSPQMPELPEVETVRTHLCGALFGATVERAQLRRRDVLRDPDGRRRGGSHLEGWLLLGNTVVAIERRGKQLYIEGSTGQGLLVRLGMSGRIALESGQDHVPRAHRHATWSLRRPSGELLVMHFIDPRRFGGLYAIQDRHDLEKRFWSRLGPDALGVETKELRTALLRTRRQLKIALLDQSVLAGVGNIYADEVLYAARLSPYRPANTLNAPETTRLANAIRDRLNAACKRGGTTLRDYRDPSGEEGGFASQLQVYGRDGKTCRRCGEVLNAGRIADRATVWCGRCQCDHKVSTE